jgi:SPW repeat
MWASIVNIILGLWLILSPSVLGMSGPAANNNHITGPLVITFAVIALWDINRNAGKVNSIIGAWLLIAILFLDYTNAAIVSNGLSAIAIILLALVKRKTKHRFGGGWRSLFQKEPLHLKEAERLS